MSVDGSIDDFGLPPFAAAFERAQSAKRKRASPSFKTRSLVMAHGSLPTVKAESVVVEEKQQPFDLTPDDFVEMDQDGKLKCDDCGVFAVDRTEDGTSAHYTCTACGVVSTTQVMEWGYVNENEYTSEAEMTKRRKYGESKVDKVLVYKLKEIQAALRKAGKSASAEMQGEAIELEMEVAAERRKCYKIARKENLKMGEAVRSIMDKVKLVANANIEKRATDLCIQYVDKHAVTDLSRLILASVCVSRAALENGIGLRWWELRMFLNEHKEDESSAGDVKSDGTLKRRPFNPSRVFNKWRSVIKRELALPELKRSDQLTAFVNSYAIGIVLNGQPTQPSERVKMAHLAAWIGDARLNRPDKENKQSDGRGRRKLTCLPQFFQMLCSKCTINPLMKYLPDGSQTKDECIKTWSMAATVIYLVLSIRPGKDVKVKGQKGKSRREEDEKHDRVTQECVEQFTGVQKSVLMACKQAIQGAIERAVDDYRFVAGGNNGKAKPKVKAKA